MSGVMMAEATGGAWRGPVPAGMTGVAIDHRKLRDGELFVALRGPNHDGHAFAAAVDGRAGALLGEIGSAGAWRALTSPQLLVESSHQALIDLAARYRQQCGVGRVIAVVGSQGKTTVRSMIAHLLIAGGHKVTQTAGNQNNLIGTPLSLLAMADDDDDAVIECGISELGEMAQLAAMVQPVVVVMPALSLAHSAGLGDLATIVREKGKMLAQAGSLCVVGAGVAKQLAQYGVKVHCRLLATDGVDAVQWRLDGCRLQLREGEQQAEVVLGCPAPHLAADMALAATVVRQLQPAWSLASLADYLASWQPEVGRMAIRRGSRGCRIVDDSYNANPASMQAALDTLAAMSMRRIAILGDMGELGEEAEQAHRALRLTGVDKLLLIGPQMAQVAEGHGDRRWFASWMEAAPAVAALASSLTEDDTVLVKGSRMMRLERAVRLLMGGDDAL